MVELSTSILTVDEETSIATFYDLEVAGTDYFHIDVMDGKFVEKNTKEKMLKYTNYLKQITNLPIDVHLMVDDVQTNISEFLSLEPNIITFHIEAVKSKEEIMEFIKQIKDSNCKVGLSIKPETPIDTLYEYLPYIHLVLIMTVEPGKGGQELIPETTGKINGIKEYIDKNNLDVYIEADGGINLETMNLVKDAGVDIIVAGTAVISSNSFKDTISKIKE